MPTFRDVLYFVRDLGNLDAGNSILREKNSIFQPSLMSMSLCGSMKEDLAGNKIIEVSLAMFSFVSIMQYGVSE